MLCGNRSTLPLSENFTSPTLILYHANCPDGFASAWLYWKVLGDKVKLIPFKHNDPLPDVTDENVLMIDVSTSLERLEVLNSQAKSFRLLDHHQSALNTLSVLPYCHFDLKLSGVGLAWNDLFGSMDDFPMALELVQRRDLGGHLEYDEDALLHYLDSLHYDFNRWDQFLSSLPTEMPAIHHQGRAMSRCISTMSKKMILNSREIRQQGFKGRAVNAPVEFAPNIFTRLTKQYPELDFVFIWSMDAKGVVWGSWRSKTINTISLAEQFNGGGHDFASGARLDLNDLNKMLNIDES